MGKFLRKNFGPEKFLRKFFYLADVAQPFGPGIVRMGLEPPAGVMAKRNQYARE
jgi:hypothetical protein